MDYSTIYNIVSLAFEDINSKVTSYNWIVDSTSNFDPIFFNFEDSSYYTTEISRLPSSYSQTLGTIRFGFWLDANGEISEKTIIHNASNSYLKRQKKILFL